jgi:ribonuclease E
VAAPAQPVAAPVAAPAAAAAPAVAAAVADTPAAGLPRVQSFELPVDALAEMAQASGLSWVNSDEEKIKLAQAAIAAQPEPIHVPREIPVRAVVDEGPLVLVETKRDLRNMSLPFEQSSAS